jgi:hypothetical protein
MKYVVFGKEEQGEIVHQVPVAFPNHMTHCLVAEAMLKSEELLGYKVISAGEFSSSGLWIKCHGKSDTLKVESRGEQDSTLFSTNDYLHGFV